MNGRRLELDLEDKEESSMYVANVCTKVMSSNKFVICDIIRGSGSDVEILILSYRLKEVIDS